MHVVDRRLTTIGSLQWWFAKPQIVLQHSTPCRVQPTLQPKEPSIGDGRLWDTVQFVPVASTTDVESLANSMSASTDGDMYVMTVRASMDAITQG